jgi:hypothetical protein
MGDTMIRAAVVAVLLFLATPAWAQSNPSAQAQLDAMVNLTTQMFQQADQLAKANAKIKAQSEEIGKLRDEVNKLKGTAAPSAPKAPGQ